MKCRLLAFALLVFGLQSAHASEPFTGSLVCTFGNIRIAGTLNRNALKVTDGGIFKVEDLDENPILAESWPKSGIVEYGLTIENSGEHGVPSEYFTVPINLKNGDNPSLLQVATRSPDGSTALKNVNGSCRFRAN